MADDPNYNSLIARLNALKPTTINLAPPSNTLHTPALGISSDEPLSREDALAQRLKSLREQRDETPSPVSRDPPPPYAESDRGVQPPQGLSHRRIDPSTPSKKAKTVSIPAARADEVDGNGHIESDDDRTLEEILDGLVLDDDHWSVSEDDGDESTSKRVEELLANLGKKPGGHTSSPPDEMQLDAKKSDEDEDDDSDGEATSRQVRDVLDKTMDELKLEGHDPSILDTPSEPPDLGPTETSPADPGLALPAVPQTPTADSSLPDPSKNPNSTTDLTLPTVPTNLQDPQPSSNVPADPFESSIAARLAALKGPGHKPITTDSFGLPSAPTFQPQDRPVPGMVAKKPGYSDEDMKTWCVVCLEDATVRCAGCDGDVYCARCWREMHVGPSAGYDERGHKWDKFDPRKM
ncbi:unnamed protein product [Discula destructiva]